MIGAPGSEPARAVLSQMALQGRTAAEGCDPGSTSLIGTNDIARREDLPNAPKRLGVLLDKLITAAPDALIVIAKLTPLSSGSASVMTHNDAIGTAKAPKSAKREREKCAADLRTRVA